MIGIVNNSRILGVKPEMVFGFVIVASVYESFGLKCEVTCGTNGKHSRGSKHYSGYALDFRTRTIPAAIRPKVAQKAREALGADFDVVLERTHLHVEFDPKTPMK